MPPTNKRAKDIERARLARQEARRRQAQAKQRRTAVISGVVVVVLVIAGVAVFAGLRGSSGGSAGASASTSPSPDASDASDATGATPTPTSSVFASPALEDVGSKVCHYAVDTATKTSTSPALPPDTKATGTHVLTVVLSEGTVVVKLDTATAPCTVNSFIYLASKGFFNNTICHRLVTSGIYVLQCGDPTGTGSGGPGYTIPDENLTGATYPAGTLAMANTGVAHTGGSQFFFVYQDSTGELGPDYTPFGTVTSGLNVLTAIAAKGSNNANGTGDGAPNEKVTIKSFSIS